MGTDRAVPADRTAQPFPQRLREQFEGVIRRFRSGSQWREMSGEFGAWQTIYDPFAQCCDVGVFAALMDGMIAGLLEIFNCWGHGG